MKGVTGVNRHFFAVESVTYAKKGLELLEKAGIRAFIKRVPNSQNKGGCGYGIEAAGDMDKITLILKKGGVKVLRIQGGGA
jgi:hypothetical protein